MNFLRLLSQDGRQNFTYTCINSAAWYSVPGYNHDLALKLLGENEDKFSYSGTRPNVVVDGCKTRKSKSETVFVVTTKKLQQLPLIDFYPVDYGLPHQAFGFAVGPVCFK